MYTFKKHLTLVRYTILWGAGISIKTIMKMFYYGNDDLFKEITVFLFLVTGMSDNFMRTIRKLVAKL